MREALIFTHPTQEGALTVNDDDVVILISRAGVELAPTGPGTWQVSMERLLSGRASDPDAFPMVMLPVNEDDAEYFLLMSDEQIEDLVGKAEQHTRRCRQ